MYAYSNSVILVQAHILNILSSKGIIHSVFFAYAMPRKSEQLAWIVTAEERSLFCQKAATGFLRWEFRTKML